MPDFSLPNDVLRNGQKHFFALEARAGGLVVAKHFLDVGKEDRALQSVGGVVSLENQTVYPGVHRDGVLTVTCEMLLKDHPVRFAPLLAELVERLREMPREESRGAGGTVARVGFSLDLPATGEERTATLIIDDVRTAPRPEAPNLEHAETLLTTATVLGLRTITGLRDLVYVAPGGFDATRTREMAEALGRLNEALAGDGRPYVLVVPGRIGSSDPSLGIPAGWSRVDGASLLVEVALPGFNVEESKGTHFFRELASHGRGYMHVSLAQPGASIDWKRIEALPLAVEGLVRHARLDGHHLVAHVDAASHRGVLALER